MSKELTPGTNSFPYIGPQPFDFDKRKFFFGRERESEDLFSLVTSYREVLVYAASGAGKTSLLNAGLLPRLKEEEIQVLGPSRVMGLMPESVRLADVANPFVFNALRTWDEAGTNCERLLTQTLSDFLPADGPETVVIFDQLEEIFEAYPERWQARQDFFEQVGRLLRDRPAVRVVFSIRQDYLASLLRFTEFLPERLKTRFHLERLRRDAALQAIVKPLQRLDRPKAFAPGVAEKLVNDLLKTWVVDESGNRRQVTGEVIEPVQLQVVCQRLWTEIAGVDGVTEITEEHRKQVGDVTEALSQFYAECLKKAIEACPGLKERQLRRFFGKELITPAGTRGFVYAGNQEQVEGIPAGAIRALIRMHLIRKEQRAGAGWYELNHDRFIEPIQRSNEEWLRQRQPAAEIKDRLEKGARVWAQAGRTSDKLLDEVGYREAERWLASPEADELGYSEKLREFVNASGRHIQREVERLRLEAERKQRETDLANQRAEYERQRYETEAKRAESERRIAESERARAESEKSRAELEYRAKQKLRFRTSAVAALAIFAVASLFIIFVYWRRARSLELAAASMNAAEVSPDISVLMALRAYRTRPPLYNPIVEIEALQRAVVSSRTRYILNAYFKDAKAAQPIYGAAFSPDGKWLATACSDNQVRIWDVADASSDRPWSEEEAFGAKLKQQLGGYTQSVLGVAFSHDGKLLATSARDGMIKIWEVRDTGDWTQRQTFTKPGPVASIAFSPTDNLLGVGSFDGTLWVWDADSDQDVFSRNAGSPIFGLSFSRDGRLASAMSNGNVTIWNLQTHADERTFPAHQGPVYSVAFSPDGQWLATSGFDHTAKLWDLETGQITKTLVGHHDILGVVTFSPTGDLLATASADGTAKLWDRRTGAELLTFSGHNSLVYGVAFSPDGNHLATASWDGTARVWRVAGGFDLIGHTGAITSIAYSGDGKFMASGSADGTARIWNTESRVTERIFRCGGDDKPPQPSFHQVNAVALSPDAGRRLVAAGCDDGSVHVWDFSKSTDQPEFILPPPPSHFPVLNVAYSPGDGALLAVSYVGGDIRVWNTDSPQQLAYEKPPINEGERDFLPFGIAFGGRGDRLAIAGDSGWVKMWDFKHNVIEPHFKAHPSANPGWVRSVAFDEAGNLITASSDRTARVWDSTGRFLFGLTRNGHQSSINAAAFGRESSGSKRRFIATASSDGTVKVWDFSTGDVLYTFSGHKGMVTGIAFSPDGRYLTSAGVDGSMHLNILDVDELKRVATSKMVRTMTWEECLTYIRSSVVCKTGL